MARLTELERKVLRLLGKSAAGNGYDFGFTDESRPEGLSPNAHGGVLTSLTNKGLIDVEDPYYGTGEKTVQVTFTEAGFRALRALDPEAFEDAPTEDD